MCIIEVSVGNNINVVFISPCKDKWIKSYLRFLIGGLCHSQKRRFRQFSKEWIRDRTPFYLSNKGIIQGWIESRINATRAYGKWFKSSSSHDIITSTRIIEFGRVGIKFPVIVGFYCNLIRGIIDWKNYAVYQIQNRMFWWLFSLQNRELQTKANTERVVEPICWLSYYWNKSTLVNRTSLTLSYFLNSNHVIL
jgi:hypothetical protein